MNTASRALEITLRREWNKAFEDPRMTTYSRGLVKKLIQKTPKNKRLATLIGNVTENEASIRMLKNAVKTGNVNVVKKLYRPRFFFDLIEKATHANVINAMTPPKTPSLEALTGHLIWSLYTKPSTIVQFMKSHKISMENLIEKKVIFKSHHRILDIFKEFEKITKKRLDFSKIQKKDMISWFSRYSTYSRNRIENDDFEIGVVLLQFMNDRGAPLIPMQNLLDYATIYMDEDGEGSWIDIPEFYDIIRMYRFHSEPVKTGTLREIFVCYFINTRIRNNANARMANQLRVILDKIVIPKNILIELSKSSFTIPRTWTEYLVARGANNN